MDAHLNFELVGTNRLTRTFRFSPQCKTGTACTFRECWMILNPQISSKVCLTLTSTTRKTSLLTFLLFKNVWSTYSYWLRFHLFQFKTVFTQNSKLCFTLSSTTPIFLDDLCWRAYYLVWWYLLLSIRFHVSLTFKNILREQ